MSKRGIAVLLNGTLEEQTIKTIDAEETGLKVLRRPGDRAELSGIIQAGIIVGAIIDAEMLEIDLNLVQTFRRHQVACVVLCDPREHGRLNAMGLDWLVHPEEPAHLHQEETAEKLLHTLQDALEERDAGPYMEIPEAEIEEFNSASGRALPGDGAIIAVWGTQGAPGRSFTAANIASELCKYGETLIIDADTVAPSLTQQLAADTDVSGLAIASRLATQGRLEVGGIREHCERLRPRLYLLSGLTEPSRWRELNNSALQVILERTKREFSWVIVDLSDGLDYSDEHWGMMGTTRHQAVNQVLAQADLTLVLSHPDPVGIRRLIARVDSIREEALLTGKFLIIVNQIRQSIAGPKPAGSIESIVRRYCDVKEIGLIPYDRNLADAALLKANDVVAAFPESELALAFRTLAQMIGRNVSKKIIPKRPRRRKHSWFGR